MAETKILSSSSLATSEFSVPSQDQAQALFSFLKSVNSCLSFSELYTSISQHLEKVFNLQFSIALSENQVFFSEKYTQKDFLIDENSMQVLNKEIAQKGNRPRKIICVQQDKKYHFLYFPLQKTSQLLNIFVCISAQNYKNIDDSTVSFLDCFHQMILSALVRLDRKEHDIKFKTIFEAFQDIYFQTDTEGTITSISPSVKDILGYSINEIVGKSLHSFLLSKENLENLFFILKERKKIKNYEIKVISKLGVTKRLLCNFQTIENQYYQNNKLLRDIVGIEGIAREVNETEKTNKETIKSKKEDIERILESKKQFLADMGHEIRTPMNGIIGMIDLLRTTPLDNEQNNYINTIEGASKNLLSILNNVLDLSKIEANKMLLKPEVFEIEPLLNQLPLLFEKELQKKSISLSISLEKGTSQYIIADKSRLLQIFSNLVSNAIKYNKPRGSVTVSVKTLKEEDKRLLLQGEVRDTGIGIPEENQEFLFDSFSKLQHNYQKTVSGTGLGLTITKQLVEIMGGTIQVWSKENEGSTFSFSFEALKSMGHNVQDNINTTDDNTTQNEINSSDWENSFVGNPSILLVDDNATNLLVAEIILTKAGCKVVTAVNGKEAIQKIKKNQFELVYMDIQMPEMDGVTATRFIKRLKISVPPIIALTAFTVAEEKERFIDAGMDDYLAKPVKAETLVRKTKQWIDSHFYATKSETKSLEKQKPTPKSKSISQTNSVTESLNTLPIVNTQTAQQLQKWGGRELVDESYQLFEEETTGLLIEAIMAFNKGDRKTLKLHVHTIKGSAATLGIDRMASLATEVDTMLKADINADVSDQMQAFEHSFEEYRLNYRIILNL